MPMTKITISRQTLLRLLGTVLAFALLFFLFSRQGWGEILEAVQRIPLGHFLLALALMFTSRLVVPARWHVLLRAAGVNISYSHSLRLALAGIFAANFLPTTIGGDIVRLAGALQLQADRAVTAASIAVDRLIGMAGMATALPLGAPAVWAWLLRPPGGAPASLRIGLAAPAAGGWWRKAWDLGMQTTRRLISAIGIWWGQPRTLLLSLAFSWGHMLAKFLSIWLLFAGMGEPLSLWRITGLWAFTYFLTLFPFSINGLGVQEISMVFVYSTIGGASMNVTLPAALLVRFLELAASLPGAFFLPGILTGTERSGAQNPEATRIDGP
jgi:uncharacterized membrane protein YbhN (UPF0104 family)